MLRDTQPQRGHTATERDARREGAREGEREGGGGPVTTGRGERVRCGRQGEVGMGGGVGGGGVGQPQIGTTVCRGGGGYNPADTQKKTLGTLQEGGGGGEEHVSHGGMHHDGQQG